MCFAAAVLSLAVFMQADAPAVTPPIHLAPADTRVWEHRLGDEEMLHRSASELAEAMKKPLGFSQRVIDCTFSVVVDAAGLVESMNILKNCGSYTDAAVAIQTARRYTPWHVDGNAARVEVEDAVSIVPPERWGPHVDFPSVADLGTLEMTLQRTTCYGSCPEYTVTVTGDGSVRFDGGWNVALPGHHSAQIGHASAADLLQQFRKADFLSALPVYHGNWTDNPTETVTLRLNGQTTKVVDYVGLDQGLPLGIKHLEQSLDEVAGTEIWVRGGGDLLGQLQREHWDFASGSMDNAALYRTAVQQGNSALIAELLRAHAPVNAGDKQHPPIVCTASGKGDPKLVLAMLASKPALSAELRDRCLVDAAQSGNPETVELWLARGADPNGAALSSGVFGWTDTPPLSSCCSKWQCTRSRPFAEPSCQCKSGAR